MFSVYWYGKHWSEIYSKLGHIDSYAYIRVGMWAHNVLGQGEGGDKLLLENMTLRNVAAARKMAIPSKTGEIIPARTPTIPNLEVGVIVSAYSSRQ